MVSNLRIGAAVMLSNFVIDNLRAALVRARS